MGKKLQHLVSNPYSWCLSSVFCFLAPAQKLSPYRLDSSRSKLMLWRMLIWKLDCFFYKSYPSLSAQSEMSPISYVYHSVIAAIQKDRRVDCSGGMELISATSAASLAHLVLELYRWNEIIVGHVGPLLWLCQQWQIYVQFNHGRPCHWICLWQHKEMGLELRIRKSISSIMLFLEQLALSRQGAVCSKHWMAVMNSSSIRDRGVFLHGKKGKPMSVQEAIRLDLLSDVWVLLSSIFTFSGTLRGHNRGFLSKSPLPKTPADKSCQALFCWRQNWFPIPGQQSFCLNGNEVNQTPIHFFSSLNRFQ